MNTNNWWSGVQKNSPVLIALLAAILTALYTVNDTHIMQNIVVSPDPFTAVMAYLTIGGWVGLAINWVLCQTPLSKVIDPSFQGVGKISFKAQMSAFGAGLIGALSTLFMLWGSQLFDPSLVLPLSGMCVFYVAIYDMVVGKVKASQILVPMALVILGIFLFTFDPKAGVTLSVTGLVVLLVAKSGTEAVGQILRQTGTIASDAASFGFWRFLWLTLIGTLLAIVASLLRGMFPTYIQTIGLALTAWPWIMLTMVLVFFAIGLGNAAMKSASASQVLVVITSLPIILGVPITWLVNRLWPGTFASAPTDLWFWLLRLAGSVLVIWGLVELNKRKK